MSPLDFFNQTKPKYPPRTSSLPKQSPYQPNTPNTISHPNTMSKSTTPQTTPAAQSSSQATHTTQLVNPSQAKAPEAMPQLPWDIDQPRETTSAAAFQPPAKDKANKNVLKRKPLAGKIAGIFKSSNTSSQAPPVAPDSRAPGASQPNPRQEQSQLKPSVHMNDEDYHRYEGQSK